MCERSREARDVSLRENVKTEIRTGRRGLYDSESCSAAAFSAEDGRGIWRYAVSSDKRGALYWRDGGACRRRLRPEQEQELHCNARKGGTMQKREASLIERNLRLVVYIAKKFDNTGVGVEDLISIGTIGLIKAINTFNPEKKIKLATYASRCIENEILMYLRRNSKTKLEVSIDEPLNVDWDGNELLLSDILGNR